MFKFFEKKQYQLTIDGYPPVQLEHKETLLNGAMRSNIAFPHSCKAGGCAACKCKLVSGKVKELTDKSYLLSKEELEQNIILGCQSIPKSDVIIELPNNSNQQQECIGTIIEQRGLTHDISEIVIRLENPIDFIPGQYAQISAVHQPYPERCYSFAHTNDVEGCTTISFIIKAVPNGKMSNWLFANEALGTLVNVKGSFGDFHLRENNSPMICIAGGSGLGPLISILESAIMHPNQEQIQRDVVLLVGAKSQLDLYYMEEIAAIKKQWLGSFTYLPVLSREANDSDWLGARGLVTDFLDDSLVKHLDSYLNNTKKIILKDAEGYLCGPPPMIDAVIKKLHAKGLSKQKLYFDKFSDQNNNSSTKKQY